MLWLSATESVKEVRVFVHVSVRVWQKDRNLLNKGLFFFLETEIKEGITYCKKDDGTSACLKMNWIIIDVMAIAY